MDSTTLNCPDYWRVVNDEEGIITCKNMNKSTVNNIKSSNLSCEDTIQFKKIKQSNWINTMAEGINNKNLNVMKDIPGMDERCKWLSTCGRVWQGVQPFCT